MVHERDNSSEDSSRLSVTDKAAMNACEIAKALDASKDSPNMSMWPISKVAVLLLDPTRKRCLIEYGPDTKGVWSIIEREFDAAVGNSYSSNQPTGQESSNKMAPGALDGPYMLQQLAFSEVERRTGLKRSNLRLLDEDLAYSLSKKETTTKLFIVQYEQTMKSNLVEMPLEDLINRMSGPLFMNDPYTTTSSVVDYYHLLPYKEILFDCLHRKWPSDSSISAPKEQSHRNGKYSLHSEIDENLEEQEANSKSKMQKPTTKVSTQKKNKQEIKAIGNRSNNNCSTSKHRKTSNVNSKRKSEAFRAIAADYAEGQDGEIPTKENESPAIADVETLMFVTSSVNAKATATSGGTVVLEAGVQMDKNRTEKHSICGNIPKDVFSVKAPWVDPVMKNGALESQNAIVSAKSGGITRNKNDQMYASLQLVQKIRDDCLHKQCILEERSAQCDMDIQTILNEGEMTPKVMTVLEKYKDISSDMMEVANSSCSGEGGQIMNIKRKRLTESVLLRNKCQELDEICRENNWILPRYKVLPSVPDGMFQASVYLTGLDLNMTADGDLKITPREARGSAASNLIFELHKKAKEKVAEQNSTTPDAKLPN